MNRALCLAGLSIAVLGGSVARAEPEGLPAASSLAAWSEAVWDRTRAGEAGDALHFLGELPAGHDAELASLRASVDQFKASLEKREAQRAERLAELKKEFEDHRAKNEKIKCLRSAVEIHTLSADKASVLASEEFSALIRDTREAAVKAEADGRWLDAQAYYSFLNALHEDSRTFEADLKRLGQRLMMLRLYVPERLHELRNQQRLAEGEKELPPFNALGEDWREKLTGIDRSMVIRAVAAASEANLNHVNLGQLLVGGYRALRTMVTTSDLSAAFPQLGDEARRQQFLDSIETALAKLEPAPDKATFTDLVGAVDRILSVNTKSIQVGESALLHEFGNGAVSELDEFTAIIWPDEIAQFQRTTEGKFVGVGIQITLNDALELKVVAPLDGTPAQRAGIRPGDLIRKINGESTLGISLSQAVDRITGTPGTPVTLGVERQGAADLVEYTMTREDIPLYTVKGWERIGAHETDWSWFIDDANRIGYVRLSQFTKDTSAELRSAFKAMLNEGLRGLIIDLRFNPGGLLTEAVNVSSFFIEKGHVVTQEDAEGREVERQNARAGQAILKGIPVAVLVNGGSASASEIVAGCLQDYERAVIVGDRSFGKGSVQQVFSIGPRAAFKLTTQYYRLPGGRLIHRRPGCETWGVEPDVRVEVLPKQMGDALTLRQDADVIEYGPDGQKVEKPDLPDAKKLLTDGLDPQLEAALLLLQTQTLTRGVKAADSTRPGNN